MCLASAKTTSAIRAGQAYQLENGNHQKKINGPFKGKAGSEVGSSWKKISSIKATGVIWSLVMHFFGTFAAVFKLKS